MGNLTIVMRTHTFRSKIVDLAMASSCIIDNQYLPEGFMFKTDATVIDIGGHIGSFAALAGILAKNGRVYTFEPDTDNFRQLQENISINKLGNVRAHNMAVTNTSGKRTFFKDHLNCAEGGFFKKGGSSVEVPTLTLEDIFRTNNITSCDLLKIDCEGSEYEILLGAPDSILNKIKKISMELHNENFFSITDPRFQRAKLLTFLKSKGFSLREQKENRMHSLVFAHKSIEP